MEKGAEGGNVGAARSLGITYRLGLGIARNEFESLKWYNKAALAGDFSSQADLCDSVFKNGIDQPFTSAEAYKEAIKWCEVLANKTSSRNPDGLELMYSRSADNLGLIYRDGLGVPQDYAEAVKWFRRAAEAGNGDAQDHLGLMYMAGQGVTRDYIFAHMWFNLATVNRISRFDYNRASDDRDAVAARMTPDQIAEAQRLAQEWQRNHTHAAQHDP